MLVIKTTTAFKHFPPSPRKRNGYPAIRVQSGSSASKKWYKLQKRKESRENVYRSTAKNNNNRHNTFNEAI